MRHLLNTLFVTLEDAYATLDGENVVIRQDDTVVGRFPLHILEGIYLFSYAGASPALMGKCAKVGISLVFLTPRGRFLARTCGESRGNVLLRRTQYRAADDPFQSCRIARNFIFGKLSNARQVLDRARRDHGERLDTERFQAASDQLKALLPQVLEETSLESLRGLEGAGATVYFGLFDEMILRNKEAFFFHGRNRRPPLDCVNAMLSFVYVMLGNDCASALEMVGLDAYVGFLHRDRPGRTSLAQDLLEELRPCMADRFALTIINNQIISPSDFQTQENGAVLLTPEGRKKIQKEWQQKKQEKITHPFLKEKLEWGLIPYVQALLLARCLRGDLDGYPPFLWR
ncbi:MAG: type I-C CRISPR-associated endonuclease Cas1c [Oscillospiraceae bacterium]|nr:type I-C CRISPR-associated endonuclease Cas1c [Oscillospiraceae bacterium]